MVNEPAETRTSHDTDTVSSPLRRLFITCSRLVCAEPKQKSQTQCNSYIDPKVCELTKATPSPQTSTLCNPKQISLAADRPNAGGNSLSQSGRTGLVVELLHQQRVRHVDLSGTELDANNRYKSIEGVTFAGLVSADLFRRLGTDYW